MTPTPDPWAAWDAGRAHRPPVDSAPLHLAFYGRCSTEDNQDPETSRQWQRDAADSLLRAATPGSAVIAEFFDIGHSRSLPWKRRPEAQRLLLELDDSNRAWDAIVVGEGQRCWYGSQFAEVAPILEHHGVTLLVPELGGAYDPSNSTHYMLMTLTGGMSRGERQRVQERVRLGMAAQVAQQGRYQGGRPPYGYAAVPFAPHPNPRKAAEGFKLKRLEPDAAAAPVVARIFADVLAGKALRAIAADLNREGILCPSAHDVARNRHRTADGWQASTLLAILDNPRYTGFEVWGKFRKSETLLDPTDASWGHTTRLVRNTDEPVRSAAPAHEALVSVEEWQAAQRVLHARSAGGLKEMAKGSRTRTDGTTHALRGVIFCTHCGRKMWAETRKPKAPLSPREDGPSRRRRKPSPSVTSRVIYRCRRKDLVEGSARWESHPASVTVGQAHLLDRVADWLGELFDPANRHATIDNLTAGLDVPSLVDVRHRQTAGRLADAQKRLDRLVASIEAGVDPAVVTPRMTAVQEEIATLSAANAERGVGPTITRADVASLVETFAGSATEVFGAEADPMEVNAFFHAMGLRIEVDAERKIARAQARLAPGTANPHPAESGVGVNDRVRGGT